MRIRSDLPDTVSYFVFNQLDGSKVLALKSGDLKEGDQVDYSPPVNTNGFYAVRFTNQGGGLEQAIGSVAKDGMITVFSFNGHVTTEVYAEVG